MSDPIQPISDSSPPLSSADNSPREFSGTKLIIGMFAFAVVMSSGLWIYWYLHTKPFQPLQHAIAQAFPKSYPQVQGGQRKIHKGTPKILRITLRVNFDPDPRDAVQKPAADEQVDSIVARLEELARQHGDLKSYDQLEVHLFQRRPEHDSLTRTMTREVKK